MSWRHLVRMLLSSVSGLAATVALFHLLHAQFRGSPVGWEATAGLGLAAAATYNVTAMSQPTWFHVPLAALAAAAGRCRRPAARRSRLGRRSEYQPAWLTAVTDSVRRLTSPEITEPS